MPDTPLPAGCVGIRVACECATRVDYEIGHVRIYVQRMYIARLQSMNHPVNPFSGVVVSRRRCWSWCAALFYVGQLFVYDNLRLRVRLVVATDVHVFSARRAKLGGHLEIFRLQ